MLYGKKTEKFDFCEHCVFGKQHRVSFSTGVHRTKDTLNHIHSDVWGPQVLSKGVASYLLILIDDFFQKSLGISPRA